MGHRSPLDIRPTDRFHAHTSPEYRHTEGQCARHPATSTTSSIHSHEPFGLFAEKPPIHSTDNHDRHRHTLRIHPILFDTHLTLRRTPSVVASHRGHRCPVAVLPRRHGRHAGNSWRSPTVPTLVWRTRRFSGATGERGQAPTASPAPRRGPSYPPPTPQTLPQPRSLLNYTTRVKRQRSTPTPCAHAWT